MKTISKNNLSQINGGGCLVDYHPFIINRPVIIFDPVPPVTPASVNPLLPLTKLKAVQLGGAMI